MGLPFSRCQRRGGLERAQRTILRGIGLFLRCASRTTARSTYLTPHLVTAEGAIWEWCLFSLLFSVSVTVFLILLLEQRDCCLFRLYKASHEL